eukprot:SAG22_NODE_18856_length_280_cov_1.342541_1_plen_53_part_01
MYNTHITYTSSSVFKYNILLNLHDPHNPNELYELCKKQQEEIMTLQFHLNTLE